MESAVIVRGRMADSRHIELSEAVPGLTSDVEVVLRQMAARAGAIGETMGTDCPRRRAASSISAVGERMGCIGGGPILSDRCRRSARHLPGAAEHGDTAAGRAKAAG
jgi:hypothetical protein